MTWMKFAGPRGARIRPFAGLYLRTPRRTRFWGWGEPPLSAVSIPWTDPAATNSAVANPAVGNPAVGNPAVGNIDRPWAAVGEWLRAAHALFGSENVNAASIASGEPVDTAQAVRRRKGQEDKRRLRFVCNRHVIGFVFD